MGVVRHRDIPYRHNAADIARGAAHVVRIFLSRLVYAVRAIRRLAEAVSRARFLLGFEEEEHAVCVHLVLLVVDVDMPLEARYALLAVVDSHVRSDLRRASSQLLFLVLLWLGLFDLFLGISDCGIRRYCRLQDAGFPIGLRCGGLCRLVHARLGNQIVERRGGRGEGSRADYGG